MIKLSIITISLNEENSIGNTIDSVIMQDFNEYEYIVIDGGSKDNTIEIIKSYGNKISRFISEPDNGIFSAQNKGIRFSQGEYVLFLNAGDYFFNNSVLTKVFSYKPDADICYGDIVFLRNSGIQYKKRSPHKITASYMFVDSIPHPATLTKRSLFEKIGYYNEKLNLSADYEFSLRAIFKYNCTYKYIPVAISVFNLKGKSSLLENSTSSIDERNFSFKINIDKKRIKFLNLFKPFLIIFLKKYYHLLDYIMNRV